MILYVANIQTLVAVCVHLCILTSNRRAHWLAARTARTDGRQRDHRDGHKEDASHRRECGASQSGGGSGERRKGGVGGVARVRNALLGGARGPAMANGIRYVLKTMDTSVFS